MKTLSTVPLTNPYQNLAAKVHSEQLIFDTARELRASDKFDRKLIHAFLDTIKLHAGALQCAGDPNVNQKGFETVQRKLLGIREQLRQAEGEMNSNTDEVSSIDMGRTLLIAGSALLAGSAFAASINFLKYETTVMSFAILMFMVGATIVTSETSVARRYVVYMWIAAMVIIGTLNGVSIMGTVIRPG